MTETPDHIPWIFSQLGSREHYAIPSLLQEEGKLLYLLTDFWARPKSIIHQLPGKSWDPLRQRHTHLIPDDNVLDLGMTRVAFDLKHKLLRANSWETTERRNEWYQSSLIKRLKARDSTVPSRGIFFSFSYTAGALFPFFKQLGWKCILGQIDPGKIEEDLMKKEAQRFPEYGTQFEIASPQYWNKWQTELEMADVICANSNWSLKGLQKQGIDKSKLKLLPLAFPKVSKLEEEKVYPELFTKTRPMRVLFLGRANLRKGIHYLIEALDKIRHLPIVLDVAGPSEVPESKYKDIPNITFHGAVPRADSEKFYKDSDVFILPTLSDGFAITQLEAQARKLPIVVSENCARVVVPGRNGILLNKVDASTLVAALVELHTNPKELAKMSRKSEVSESFSLETLKNNLRSLEEI